MREELKSIHKAIADHQLPATFDELFGSLWDGETYRFAGQETYVIDFKEGVP